MKIDSGTVYALLASIAFAVYIILGRKAALKSDAVWVNIVSFAFGIAALAAWLGIKGVSISPKPLMAELPLFLFLGIGVSGLGYVTFISAIKKLGQESILNFSSETGSSDFVCRSDHRGDCQFPFYLGTAHRWRRRLSDS